MLIEIVLVCSTLIFILFIYLLYQYIQFSKIYTGNKINISDQKRTDLLIIDIQNDLAQPDGKVSVNIKQADQIINNINIIIKQFEKSAVEIVYIKHEYENYLFKLLFNNALASKKYGSEFDNRLHVVNKNIFIKNVMDPFSNTKFQFFLDSKNIGHLIVTGIDANYCIDKSIQSSLRKKYKITLISDGIAGKTDEKRNKKIIEFRERGANILTTKELLAL